MLYTFSSAVIAAISTGTCASRSKTAIAATRTVVIAVFAGLYNSVATNRIGNIEAILRATVSRKLASNLVTDAFCISVVEALLFKSISVDTI